ncbi:MAG: hypothetical protein ACN4G0_07700 [Polyangiales bacterium]
MSDESSTRRAKKAQGGRFGKCTVGSFLPLILAGAYFSMGPSDCGGDIEGDVTPENLKLYTELASIEIPILKSESWDGGTEEPYFIGFEWWATSKNAETNQNGNSNVKILNRFPGSDDLPSQAVRRQMVEGSQVLLPETFSRTWGLFDEQVLPKTLEDAENSHVKISGITICAFEDDTDGDSPFVYNRVYEYAQSAQGDFKKDLEAFTQRTISDPYIAEKANVVGIITSVLGIAVDLVPKLIALFKKDPPTPDDFAGCASFAYVGVPHSVLDDIPGPKPPCYSSSRNLLCPIDARPEDIPYLEEQRRDDGVPPQLRFVVLGDEDPGPSSEGLDIRLNRTWLADVELRTGLYRTSRSAHETYTVAAGATAGDLWIPAPTHQRLVTSGQRVLRFAHVVDYQTLWTPLLNFDIRPSGSGFLLDVVAGLPVSSVSVRVSTVTLPQEVEVHRETATISSGETFTFWYPEAYQPSDRYVVIPEILSLQQGLGRFEFEVESYPDRAEVRLQGYQFPHTLPVNWPGTDGPDVQMTVRMTWISGTDPDLRAPMNVKRLHVTSNQEVNNGAADPEERTLNDWNASQADGANLYFLDAFDSDLSHNSGWHVRAVGAEFLEYDTGTARLLVQDTYDFEGGSAAWARGKLVNISFME